MRQPDDELGRDGTFFGRRQVGFDGVPLLGRQGYPSAVCGRTIAFLEQQEEEFKPVRHAEFFKDMKEVVLDRMLAESELIGNLLVTLALCGTLCHLKFARGKLVDLAGVDAVARGSAPESFQQKLRMVLIDPNLAPADMLDATGKFGQ